MSNELTHAEQLFVEFSDLTEQQRVVASALALRSIFYPEKTIGEVCEEHGVTTRSELYWRGNPRYVEFKNRVGAIILSDYEITAHTRLLELIASSNKSTSLKALQIFYTVQGKMQQTAGRTPNTFIHIEQSGKDDRIIIGEIEALREKLEQHKKQ